MVTEPLRSFNVLLINRVEGAYKGVLPASRGFERRKTVIAEKLCSFNVHLISRV